jgi:hypothetical protein
MKLQSHGPSLTLSNKGLFRLFSCVACLISLKIPRKIKYVSSKFILKMLTKIMQAPNSFSFLTLLKFIYIVSTRLVIV